MRIDLHQHLWTAPLLEALGEREEPPFVRRTGELAVLHCRGELPYAIDVSVENPRRRAEQVRADGLDLAVVALSSPIGIEALPREQAVPLIEAHLRGVSGAGEAFAPWGPIALDRPDPDDVDGVLGLGCAGVSLPAGPLAHPDAPAVLRPILERVAARGVPLFIHPGPGPQQAAGEEPSVNEPVWWRALTAYVAQMQAAWLTFVTAIRREHPGLLGVFAMLAGGAPLLSERLELRGGPPIALQDSAIFYDTSGYGPVAVGALAARVGAGQLVYGSDRPVAEPVPTEWDAAFQTSAAGLLGNTREHVIGKR